MKFEESKPNKKSPGNTIKKKRTVGSEKNRYHWFGKESGVKRWEVGVKSESSKNALYVIAIPTFGAGWLCFVVYKNRGSLSSRFYNSWCGEVFGSQWMFVIACCFYNLFWVLPVVRAQVLLLSLPLLYRNSKELPLCAVILFCVQPLSEKNRQNVGRNQERSPIFVDD